MTERQQGILSSDNTTAVGGKLTEADLVKTWIALLERKPQPHRHLLASNAEPGTWRACADCGTLVLVPEGWS